MKHFYRSEFACKCGCGFDSVDFQLARILDDVRGHFGEPVIVTSGCRCPSHNESVGGAKASQHLYGRAADIAVKNTDPEQVKRYIEQTWNPRGLKAYQSWVHVDTRSGPKWRG